MYFKSLNEDEKNIIYKQINTNAEKIKRDVEDLMEWMKKQPHLPNVNDETFLTHFLIRSKNSMERAKQKLDFYYTCKSTMVDVFSDREKFIPLILQSQKYISYTPLPNLMPNGQRVIVFKVLRHGGDNYTNPDILQKGFQTMSDLLLKLDSGVSNILIFDLDTTNINASLVALGFAVAKKQLQLGTKVVPFRLHRSYLLNVSSMIEPLITLSKSLVSKKLSDRMVIWKKDPKDLVEEFPKNVLPSDYGGVEKSVSELADMWSDEILKHRDWLISDAEIKADLSKKSKADQLSNGIDGYGVEGSFRKMNLD